MTFWDFYGQHPVLGTIVALLAFVLLLVLLLILSSFEISYRSGSSGPPGKAREDDAS